MKFADAGLVDRAKALDLPYVNGYFDGFVRALYLFAYWRDGEMYVGSVGGRYKDIRAEFVKEFNEKISDYFGERVKESPAKKEKE